jgi:hypothetical protein
MATLNIRVQPRASRNEIVLPVGGDAGSPEPEIRVRVTAPPTDGKANDAVLRLLAKQLGVGRSALTIVSGESSRNKVIAVEGVSEAEIRQLLGAPGQGRTARRR